MWNAKHCSIIEKLMFISAMQIKYKLKCKWTIHLFSSILLINKWHILVLQFIQILYSTRLQYQCICNGRQNMAIKKNAQWLQKLHPAVLHSLHPTGAICARKHHTSLIARFLWSATRLKCVTKHLVTLASTIQDLAKQIDFLEKKVDKLSDELN